MIYIALENSEAKSLVDFVEMEFPLFIKEGEVDNMDYIFEVSSAYKKIKNQLEAIPNCETQNEKNERR